MRKCIGIYTNTDKDVDLKVTSRLISRLKPCGFDVVIHRDIAGLLPENKTFDEREDGKPFDTLLTVGGDGTILRIAEYCALRDIAILGVNLGTVGFLTEIELGALDSLPELLASDSLVSENRSLLKVDLGNRSFLALNEVVISRDFSDRMIRLGVYVDDMLADKYYCDGYIISTPTGSTAYSLSAGGCVLSPEVNALSLLAINSHSLHSRPIIVSDRSTVKVSVLATGKSCSVVGDGKQFGYVRENDVLTVSKAKERLRFLKLKESNFYEKLLSKLNTWSVTPK